MTIRPLQTLIFALAVAVAATLAGAALVWTVAHLAGWEAHGGPVACHEDEPCFDCAAMGNGRCGARP